MLLEKDDTICFWGHTSGDNAFLSNFYPHDYYTHWFGGYVHSSEQHFMLSKAELFGDKMSFLKIRDCKTAKEAKALGRQVKNFNDQEWSVMRQGSMHLALSEKFVEPGIRKKLIDTGDKYLIEASPYDKIWGVGMGADNPDIYDTDKWQGLNELGHCLMLVRRCILQEERLESQSKLEVIANDIIKDLVENPAGV